VPALYQHDPFLALQGLLWGDTFLSDALWLGATWACTGWGMTAIALLFVWWRTGSASRLVRRTVPAFTALLLAGAVVQTIKALVRAPRPQATLEAGTFHVLEVLRGTHSFPSGHSASAAALATWAALRFGWRAWPLVLLALLGGLSRVAVGAHWTVDVLAGWTVGVGGALLARWAEPAVERFVGWIADRIAARRSAGTAP
jgi:membrane-associated phospholipid phosphatase